MMSLGYRLDSLALSRDSLSVLSLAAGLAVLRTVDACLSGLHTVQIHWPNDVYVDGAKIAGILLESPDPLSVVLGIGINVNNRLEEAPLEIREALSTYPITTMFDLLGRSTDRVGLIVDFLDRFQELIERISRNPEPVIREVERCCIQVGRELTVRHETRLIRGRCLGLGPDASLHLETAEGLRQIHTGIVQSGG